MTASPRGLYTFNTANELLCTVNGRRYTKYSVDAAYGCYARGTTTHGCTPYLVSKVVDAVKYKADGGGPWNDQVSYTYGGETWYVAGTTYGYGGAPINSNGSLIDFTFTASTDEARFNEFMDYVLSLPIEEIPIYTTSSKGIHTFPEGYNGLATLLLR